MAEAVYPLLARHAARRSRRLRLPVRPRVVAVAVLAGTALTAAASLAFRAPAPDLAIASRALDRGQYSAARAEAMALLHEGASVPAALMLARAELALGNGQAAGDAIARAAATGAAASSLRAMRADALLLTGDPKAAWTAAGRDGGAYAARIRARIVAANGDIAGAQAMLAALTEGHPRDAAAWTDLGRLRLSAGDLGGASAAASTASRLTPGEPAALTLTGEVVRARYGLAAALPWFQAALDRDPRFPPALAEAAATLGDLGRNAEMLAMTRRLLAARPGDARAFYLQAVLALRAGNTDLARDLLQSTGGTLRAVPGVQLVDGATDYRSGRFEQAAAKWGRLAADQPLNVSVRRLLAMALLRAGDAPGALDAIRPIVLRADADPYALRVAADAFAATGNAPAAAGWRDRADIAESAPAVFASDRPLGALRADAARHPHDPSFQLGVIRGLFGAGDPSGGVVVARGLATQSPGSPAAQAALGDALTGIGRPTEAIAAYARAAALRFDEPAVLRLVDALQRAGRRDDAARTLAIYLAQSPRSVAARRLLARWQLEAGMFAPAAATLGELRRDVGDRDAGLLVDLTRAQAGLGNGADAVRFARAAYRLQPMSASVTNTYARTLAAAGDRDGARQLLAKAAALTSRQR